MASGSSKAPIKDRKNSADDFESVMNPPSTNKVVSNSSVGSTIKKLDVDIDTSKFKLQTKNPVFQQVEIEVLQESIKLQAEIQKEITKTRGEMKTKHMKYSEKFLDTYLCDILDMVGDDVTSFDNMIKRLEQLVRSANHQCQYSCKTCNSNPEGQEVENKNNFKKPPLPPNTATKNLSDTYSSTNSSSSNQINETVASSTSTTSSNKTPRVYQPGEILYSKNFSPLVMLPIPEEEEIKTPPGRKERLQIADGKNKIEIDVVLKTGKGGKNEQKLFNEFISGVKQIKTARTTVTQKRVMLPRVPKKPKETTTKPFAESSGSSAASSASSSQEKDKKLRKETTPTPAKKARLVGNKFKKQGEWVI